MEAVMTNRPREARASSPTEHFADAMMRGLTIAGLGLSLAMCASKLPDREKFVSAGIVGATSLACAAVWGSCKKAENRR